MGKVGSILWTARKGDAVRRGDELGYFAYGGSTIVALFPKSLMQCVFPLFRRGWRCCDADSDCEYDAVCVCAAW